MVNISFYKLQYIKEKTERYDLPPRINRPSDLYDAIVAVTTIAQEAEEVLYMLALNTKNKIIGVFEVSRGTLNASLVSPREVFKRALLINAASIVLAHNHPSGDSTPSSEDKQITTRIKSAGQLLGIELLDHLVCTEEGYTSLKEQGFM